MSDLSRWWNIPNGQLRKRMEVLKTLKGFKSYERIAISREEYNKACADASDEQLWIDAGIELMQQHPEIFELTIDVWGGSSILAKLKRSGNEIKVKK